MKKLVALAIAALAAYWWGAWIGNSFWGGQPYAALYGVGAVFVAVGIVVYLIEDENLVTFGFAAIVASQYGIPVGYRLYSVHDDLGAKIYGYPTVFMAALIVGYIVVWPLVRRVSADTQGRAAAGWLRFSAKRKQAAPIDPEKIDQMISDGMVFAYPGLIDRDLAYNEGRPKKGRLRVNFTVQRNTLAMSDSEQEGVRIWHVLSSCDALPPDVADRAQFALAWGDGRAEVYGGKFTANAVMLQQNNIRSLKDAVAFEAGHRGLSGDGAISELFTVLQGAAQSKEAPDAITNLYDRYRDRRNARSRRQ